MNRVTWLGLIALLIGDPASVWASPPQTTVYKCAVQGVPTYQDTPCGEPLDTNSLTVLGHSRADRAVTLEEAIEQLSAVKSERERQERISRAIVGRRLTVGMSEADARRVYGEPIRVERDGYCRRFVWRDPEHAARICYGSVSAVLY